MGTSLFNLANNFYKAGLEKFEETSKIFNAKSLSLITWKGVFPYEYSDSREKIEQKSLPPKKEFYSSLNNEDTHRL